MTGLDCLFYIWRFFLLFFFFNNHILLRLLLRCWRYRNHPTPGGWEKARGSRKLSQLTQMFSPQLTQPPTETPGSWADRCLSVCLCVRSDNMVGWGDVQPVTYFNILQLCIRRLDVLLECKRCRLGGVQVDEAVSRIGYTGRDVRGESPSLTPR